LEVLPVTIGGSIAIGLIISLVFLMLCRIELLVRAQRRRCS
jgi:hypothetical protein